MKKVQELNTEADVVQFLEKNHKSIIFKAGSCWITDRAWGIVQEVLSKTHESPVGIITVVKYRNVSNYVAQVSGILHQSPQILIMQGQKSLFESNNMRINKDEIEQQLSMHFNI